jgi:V/A-type H+-transporting ATPase subunit I
MFRPARMVWVELLADPDGVGVMLERLAAAGIFEPRPQSGAPPFVTIRASARERLEDLARRIQPLDSWLPPPEQAFPVGSQMAIEDIVAGIENDFQGWLEAAGPAIAAARLVRAELANLRLLEKVLGALPAEAIEFTYWPQPGDNRVYAPFLALGPEAAAEAAVSAGGEASRRFPISGEENATVVLGLAATPELPTLERQWHARGMHFVSVPPGLHGSASEALAQVRVRIARAENRLGAELVRVDHANRTFRVARAGGLLRRCLWTHRILGEEAASGRHFVWFGGWTPRRRLRELEAVLQASGVAYLLSIESSGARHEPPPVELFNPRFARGYEIFVRAFGVPAGTELDPSPVLAMLMPLLFGYMFGDVGHGLMLALFGHYAGRRMPVLRLLIPAGLVSAAFGFLYGEVFGLEHVFPALAWRPLDEPLLTLLLPLGLGASVLLMGFVFEALQSHAAGAMRHWWQAEFPVLVLYLGALAAPLSPPLAGLAACAALIAILAGTRKPAALAARLMEVLHALVQLLVNTVSFMRVGAFALAHAGLSSAVGLLAQVPEGDFSRALVWLLGNALVIGLEGLVVSVQTTRLMLFEFFRRFLHGGGRPFRPLTLPPELVHSQTESTEGVSA